jgi:6-phosphogluconolactonase
VSAAPRIFTDVAALHDAAAAYVADVAAGAIAERGRFLLVLAGGTTPAGAYRCLADGQARRVDWPRVHLFWGDERCVEPSHPGSNYRLASDTLLRRVPLPEANVHRIRGELGPERAAARYDAELQRFFGAARPGDLRDGHAFDLVLLGIGADGHTASLFPGSAALDATGWAVAASAPPPAEVRERVSLTLPAIGRSRAVLFLATGRDKRGAVEAALAAPGPGSSVPAGRVRPRGALDWLIDAAAAPGS